jgi:hypothetical protein
VSIAEALTKYVAAKTSYDRYTDYSNLHNMHANVASRLAHTLEIAEKEVDREILALVARAQKEQSHGPRT